MFKRSWRVSPGQRSKPLSTSQVGTRKFCGIWRSTYGKTRILMSGLERYIAIRERHVEFACRREGLSRLNKHLGVLPVVVGGSGKVMQMSKQLCKSSARRHNNFTEQQDAMRVRFCNELEIDRFHSVGGPVCVKEISSLGVQLSLLEDHVMERYDRMYWPTNNHARSCINGIMFAVLATGTGCGLVEKSSGYL